MELTPEERQRIYLEEKARAEAVGALKIDRQEARPAPKAIPMIVTLGIILS